jgi:hypothetical protein
MIFDLGDCQVLAQVNQKKNSRSVCYFYLRQRYRERKKEKKKEKKR